MERFVISLEQAKKLVELGFKAESQKSWVKSIFEDNPWFLTNTLQAFPNYENYPAYHVGELGEILPNYIQKLSDYYWLGTVKYDQGGWAVFYKDNSEVSNGYLTEEIFGETEAQARGALIIYLIENNLL